MPTAVAAVVTIVTSVAAVVAPVVAGIASVIAVAVAGTVAAVASMVGGLVAGIGGLIQGIGVIVGGINQAIIKPIADTLIAVAGNITTVVKDISGGLSYVIGGIKRTIEPTVIMVYDGVKWVTQTISAGVDAVALPILTPIKETLELVKGTVDAIKAPVDAIIEPMRALRETIESITSLKILGDLLKGTGRISDLLGPVSEGQSVATATAIAELTKTIAGSTVGMIDKVDQQFTLLGATVDTFDKRLSANIDMQLEQNKAEILAVVTPRMTTFGDNQQKLLRGIARISRHLEDEQWFAVMLLRALG